MAVVTGCVGFLEVAGRLKPVRIRVRFTFRVPENAAGCFLCPSMTKYQDTSGTGYQLAADTLLSVLREGEESTTLLKK